MIFRSLSALCLAASISISAFAHDVNVPAGAPQVVADPANPDHVHIHTSGPAAEATYGVSSPDDEDYTAIDALLPPPKHTAVLLAEAYQCRPEKLAQGLPRLERVTLEAAALEPEPRAVAPIAAAKEPAKKLATKKPAAKPAAEPMTTASIKPAPKLAKKPAKKLRKKKPVAASTELY